MASTVLIIEPVRAPGIFAVLQNCCLLYLNTNPRIELNVVFSQQFVLFIVVNVKSRIDSSMKTCVSLCLKYYRKARQLALSRTHPETFSADHTSVRCAFDVMFLSKYCASFSI